MPSIIPGLSDLGDGGKDCSQLYCAAAKERNKGERFEGYMERQGKDRRRNRNRRMRDLDDGGQDALCIIGSQSPVDLRQLCGDGPGQYT